ncbi:MAG: bacillithiol biosynthesis deacetylase BshB1 [Candidatus Eiseniibacteriota bacterium]
MADPFGADLLVVGAHPDDLELHFGGIAARAAADGLSVVGLDLTRGERATRGNPETRAAEALAAAKVLGLAERLNAGLPDTSVHSGDDAQVRAVVSIVRRVRPRWVLLPHPEDAHPDHREGGRLLERALYFAHVGGYLAEGARHRVLGHLYDWPEAGSRAGGMRAHGAGFVIDVSASFETKRRALECYVSQFTANKEADAGAGATRLTRPTFLGSVEAKARRLGELVGVEFGEGLVQAGALLWREPLGGLFGARGLGGGPTA